MAKSKWKEEHNMSYSNNTSTNNYKAPNWNCVRTNSIFFYKVVLIVDLLLLTVATEIEFSRVMKIRNGIPFLHAENPCESTGDNMLTSKRLFGCRKRYAIVLNNNNNTKKRRNKNNNSHIQFCFEYFLFLVNGMLCVFPQKKKNK